MFLLFSRYVLLLNSVSSISVTFQKQQKRDRILGQIPKCLFSEFEQQVITVNSLQKMISVFSPKYLLPEFFIFGIFVWTSCSAFSILWGRTVLGCAYFLGLYPSHPRTDSSFHSPFTVSFRLGESHLNYTFTVGMKDRLKM